MKRKKTIPLLLSILLVLALLAAAWAFFVEPRMLTTNELHFTANEERLGHGIKIAQFTDTHLGFGYDIEQLERLVEEIMAHEPDLIVFTGDLMDKPSAYKRRDEIPAVLSRLTAPLGKYAVWGNHDVGGGGTRLYGQIMEASGFVLLTNERVDVALPGGATLRVSGLDEVMMGNPDYSIVPPTAEPHLINLVLAHEPDEVDKLPYGAADFILSGHSHGGQIRLPFVGALVSPPHARSYSKGVYETNGSLLYVDSGIGTTRIAARFLNPPQYSILHLTY